MDFIILVVIGCLVGFLGTLVGVGGGFLVVPLLFLVYGFSPQLAIGTSLVVVLCNAFSGAIAYAVQGRIQYRLAWRFALMTIPGAIIGSWLSRFFNPVSFRIVLGVFLITLAVYLLIKSLRQKKEQNIEPSIPCTTGDGWRGSREPKVVHRHCLPRPLAMGGVYLLNFSGGILSGFLGIGGGIICVPVLIYFLKVPVHLATATSLFILTFTSLSGSVTHFALGHIELYYALALGLGALLGAQAGAMISKRIHTIWIILLLSLILALTGIRLLVINIS